MKDWFEFCGIRCTSYGIHVTTQPSIIRASERVTYTNVPGRSGSLTTLEANDVYDDFILPIECTVADMNRLTEICAWLKGAGTLKLAARPGGFYYARIANQIEFSKILRGHENRAFTVNFRCQPFWHMENVTPITLTTSESIVTNPGNVSSEPVITITGSGEITLMIGSQIVELTDVDGSITLDTPLMEAYSGTSTVNQKMSGDFPILLPGANPISWTGNVVSVVIQPNWRYL